MAECSLDEIVMVPESVLSRELEGETVILNLDTGIYFGLNQMGTAMWTLVRDRGSVREAYGALLSEYDVAPSALEADLLGFVDAMLAKGLVRREEGAPR